VHLFVATRHLEVQASAPAFSATDSGCYRAPSRTAGLGSVMRFGPGRTRAASTPPSSGLVFFAGFPPSPFFGGLDHGGMPQRLTDRSRGSEV
jgi:hypothetical protein